jgi:hypothetical protein
LTNTALHHGPVLEGDNADAAAETSAFTGSLSFYDVADPNF